VHTRQDVFLQKKCVVKARERELATFDKNRRAVGVLNPVRGTHRGGKGTTLVTAACPEDRSAGKVKVMRKHEKKSTISASSVDIPGTWRLRTEIVLKNWNRGTGDRIRREKKVPRMASLIGGKPDKNS